MDKSLKQQTGVVQTWPEHDCYEYVSQVWENHKDYNRTYCSLCKNTTGFRWKSLGRRVKSFFGTAEGPY